MEKIRWNTRLQIIIWCSVLVHLTLQVETISNFEGHHQQQPLQISPKELRRLRAKGLEIMPTGNTLSSGPISGEPSCEELRAMWRYYRRQARAAELTNQIPQFQLEDFFWGLGPPGEPQSFGSLKGRTRPRLRQKGSRNPYGRVLFQKEKSPEAGRRRRPMEEVLQMFGPSQGKQSPNSDKSEPTILLSPPLEPTPKSGLQKIKEMFRDERVKAAELKPTTSSEGAESRDYGKVVLSPPAGQDGRVANKPRELMTPFERIRFGHTDELFNVNDDTPRRQGSSHLFPLMKRRNGFIALPMLNRQRSNWNSFVMKSPKALPPFHRVPTPPTTAPPPKFEDSIIILQNPNGGGGGGGGGREFGGFPVESLGPSGSHDYFRGEDDERKGSSGNEELVSLLAEYELDNAPVDLLSEKEPLMVEESIPLCTDVQDQSCSINSDCSCVGHGLYRCHAGQCQTLSLKGTVSDENGDSPGLWHSEPLSISDLGIWEDGTTTSRHQQQQQQQQEPVGGPVMLEDKKRKRAVDAKKA